MTPRLGLARESRAVTQERRHLEGRSPRDAGASQGRLLLLALVAAMLRSEADTGLFQLLLYFGDFRGVCFARRGALPFLDGAFPLLDRILQFVAAQAHVAEVIVNRRVTVAILLQGAPQIVLGLLQFVHPVVNPS